jgi:hypothetical protein
MLKFKEFEYTTFKPNGFEDATYTLGREVWIEYQDKTKDDIPRLVMDMLIEAHQGTAFEVLKTQNLLFQANYLYYNGEYEEENMVCFLTTPSTYKEVFNVQT